MDNENRAPSIALYVSVSVERGQVKTSCSAHLTCAADSDRAEVEEATAEAMAAAMAVAALATQSVVALLTNPLDPAAVGAFVRRVNRVATGIAEGA